jgi:hypothetical protein
MGGPAKTGDRWSYITQGDVIPMSTAAGSLPIDTRPTFTTRCRGLRPETRLYRLHRDYPAVPV